jgi:hypothetical protein
MAPLDQLAPGTCVEFRGFNDWKGSLPRWDSISTRRLQDGPASVA